MDESSCCLLGEYSAWESSVVPVLSFLLSPVTLCKGGNLSVLNCLFINRYKSTCLQLVYSRAAIIITTKYGQVQWLFVDLLVCAFLRETRRRITVVCHGGRLSCAVPTPLGESVRLPSGVTIDKTAQQTGAVQKGMWHQNVKWPAHRWKTNLWDLQQSHWLVSKQNKELQKACVYFPLFWSCFGFFKTFQCFVGLV